MVYWGMCVCFPGTKNFFSLVSCCAVSSSRYGSARNVFWSVVLVLAVKQLIELNRSKSKKQHLYKFMYNKRCGFTSHLINHPIIINLAKSYPNLLYLRYGVPSKKNMSRCQPHNIIYLSVYLYMWLDRVFVLLPHPRITTKYSWRSCSCFFYKLEFWSRIALCVYYGEQPSLYGELLHNRCVPLPCYHR